MKAGIFIGVLGILSGAAAFGYSMVEIDGLKEEIRKTRAAQAAAEAKLAESGAKLAERVDKDEKAGAAIAERLTGVEKRAEILEKPAKTVKEVAEDPIRHLTVRNVKLHDSGVKSWTASIASMEVENVSEADIAWMELSVTYFTDKGELGTKVFTVGQATARCAEKAVAGRRGVSVIGVAADGRKLAWTMDRGLTQVPGTPTRAEVKILRVQVLN